LSHEFFVSPLLGREADMSQFTAKGGIRYSIEYDLPLVRDVRKATGIDLIGADGVTKATSSVIDFAELLWHTCREQAERQGIDEGAFIRSIQDCLDDAVTSWLKAVTSFFDTIGRGALARLAESLVETERADRKESNQLMDRKTAGRITKVAMATSTAKRQKALAKLIGKEGEGDESTPGQPSPS
jgi:hypothetical protein